VDTQTSRRRLKASASDSDLRLQLGRAARVWVLTGVVAAAAAVIFARQPWGSPAPNDNLGIPWWLLVLGFYITEGFVVHFQFRREAHTISLSEIPLVLGLFSTSPFRLVLAQLIGAGFALALRRKQRPLKAAFNLAQFAFCTSVAIQTFYALGGPQSQGPRAWGAAFAATALASVTGLVLVMCVVFLAEGHLRLRELPEVAVVSLTGSFASTSFALAALALVEAQPGAAWLLIGPCAALVLAFYAYTSQRRKHENVEFLYESLRSTQAATDFASVVEQLLLGARKMLRAELAEILLFPSTSPDQVLRSTIGPADRTLMEPELLGSLERRALDLVLTQEEALLLPKKRESQLLDAYLEERGVEDGMMVALRAEERVLGTLLIGERSGDIDTFSLDDARLLETFARHASVLLQNEQLEKSLAQLTELQDQLKHQAYHDGLTGLPNRAFFSEKLEDSLRTARSDGFEPAVLYLDLDDFKMINDRLGHTAGDELLVIIAHRLKTSVRRHELPARLGGDEFAVLIRDARTTPPEEVAARLVGELGGPYMLHGHELPLHVSVGIATSATGHTADELLSNADLAMYSIKEGKDRGDSSYAVFEMGMRERLHRQHELATSLSRALEADDLTVHYQPIVSLTGGDTVGLEALARWRRRGFQIAPPAEFLHAAQKAGLMVEIGQAMLGKACVQMKAWQEALPHRSDLCVNVNLSPAEFQNPNLSKEVAGALLEARLDPHCLILEITESTAMLDPDQTLDTMSNLRRLGVRFALDDFGTGHSSLSHLCDFSFDYLKIAKTFVDRLRLPSRGSELPGAIVQLGESLGLTVVAEGIESPEQAMMLRALDCQLGQGFHFSPPLDIEAAGTYLGIQGGPALALVETA
jgi:diguanylate cyclase (GGDEF)-like protein